MKQPARFLVLCAVLMAARTASAASIDFESYVTGSEFSSPLTIGDVSFGSTGKLLVTDLGTGNALCGSLKGACTGSLDLAIRGGAHDLNFTFAGDTDPTTQYIMDVEGSVFHDGQKLDIQFLAIAYADGNSVNEQLIHFDNPNVTINSLNISSLDGTAFVIDNLNYVPASPVPEPASGVLGLLGAGALLLKLRSRPTLS